MNYFLCSLFICLYFGALIFLAIRSFDDHAVIPRIGVFAMLAGGLSLLFFLVDQENKQGPCVESEIQMHWNPATKTMMPAKVCIVRGKWVE